MSKPKNISRRYLEIAIIEALDLPINNQNKDFARKVLRTIQTMMTDALLRDEEVYINGFGKFKTKRSREKVYLPRMIVYSPPGEDTSGNVYSPVPVMVKGKKKVIFKPAIQLQALLNHEDPTFKEKEAIAVWNK